MSVVTSNNNNNNRELEERRIANNNSNNDDNHIDNRYASNDTDDGFSHRNNNNKKSPNQEFAIELKEQQQTTTSENNSDFVPENIAETKKTSTTTIDIPSDESSNNEKDPSSVEKVIAAASSSSNEQEESTESATQPQPQKLPFNYNLFLQRVFSLMFVGLCVTAFTCFLCQAYGVDTFLVQHIGVFIGLIIFEIILVFYLIYAFMKMSYQSAAGAFFFYAFLNGITITPMVTSYTPDSVGLAFLCTSSVFLAMALIGYFTKKDLSSWGPILSACLFGLIITSIVNLFLQSTVTQFVICIVGVLVFSGLTAYDVNTLKQIGEQIGNKSETEEMMKLAVFGALQLYLDFINLFLYLLQLLGKARN